MLRALTNFVEKTNMHLKVGVGRRAGEDTALAGSLDTAATGEQDVAIVTPAGAPRVLDLVVVNAVEGAVTDGEDTVVKVGAAGGGEDTRLVQLEGGLVSLDGDGHGALVQGSHHGGVGVLGDIGVAGRSGGSVLGARGLGAGASLLGGAGGVRVSGLSAETTVLLDPGEGVVHQTTVAAHVFATVGASVAINELLLGEGLQVAVLVVVSTLKSTGGGERPAGAALALILDRGDGTLGNPVDGGSQGGEVSRSLKDAVSLDGRIRAVKAKADVRTPLINGHVGELVVAKGVGQVLGVVGLDQIIVVGEVLEHLDEVLAGGGGNVVLAQPVEELLLVVGAVVGVSRGSRKL